MCWLTTRVSLSGRSERAGQDHRGPTRRGWWHRITSGRSTAPRWPRPAPGGDVPADPDNAREAEARPRRSDQHRPPSASASSGGARHRGEEEKADLLGQPVDDTPGGRRAGGGEDGGRASSFMRHVGWSVGCESTSAEWTNGGRHRAAPDVGCSCGGDGHERFPGALVIYWSRTRTLHCSRPAPAPGCPARPLVRLGLALARACRPVRGWRCSTLDWCACQRRLPRLAWPAQMSRGG